MSAQNFGTPGGQIVKKRVHVAPSAIEDIKVLAFLLEGPRQVRKLVSIQNWSEFTLQYVKNGGPIQIPTCACAPDSVSFPFFKSTLLASTLTCEM